MEYGMLLTGENGVSRRRTCTALSTTNPMWADLGANPGLRSERPATNRWLSFDRVTSQM
jgi:hypothetical protein